MSTLELYNEIKTTRADFANEYLENKTHSFIGSCLKRAERRHCYRFNLNDFETSIEASKSLVDMSKMYAYAYVSSACQMPEGTSTEEIQIRIAEGFPATNCLGKFTFIVEFDSFQVHY